MVLTHELAPCTPQHVAVDDDNDVGELLDVTSAEAVLAALGEMPSLRKSGRRPPKSAAKPASQTASQTASTPADAPAAAASPASLPAAGSDSDTIGTPPGAAVGALLVVAAAAATYYYYPQLSSSL